MAASDEEEVALAAIEDGDGVEGVQLYVCGSDGELELLALEGKAGGRRWHLKARAADLVTAPNDARYPEQACRIAREAADGCSRGDRLTASIEHGALKVSIKRKIGGTGVTASRLARVLAATLVPVRGDAAAAAEQRCRTASGKALRAADARIKALEQRTAELEAAQKTMEETLEKHVEAVKAADLAPDFARILATRAPASAPAPPPPPHDGESSSDEDDDSDAECPDTPERAPLPPPSKPGFVPGTKTQVVAFDLDQLDDICGPVKSEPRVKREVKKEVKKEVKREKKRKSDILSDSDSQRDAPPPPARRKVKPEPPQKKKKRDILSDSDSDEFD